MLAVSFVFVVVLDPLEAEGLDSLPSDGLRRLSPSVVGLLALVLLAPVIFAMHHL